MRTVSRKVANRLRDPTPVIPQEILLLSSPFVIRLPRPEI